MNFKKLKIALLTFGCLSFSLSMHAQQQNADKKPPNAEKIIQKFDADKDGKLSLEEMKESQRENLIKRFNRTDTDNDGFITEQELSVMLEKRKNMKNKKED